MKMRYIIVALLLAGAAAGGWAWWQQRQDRLPPDIAAGNGRIEATEVQIATRYAGRVAEVLVREGDLVEAGQVLARMDTRELRASLARAEAEIAQAERNVAQARAAIAQRRSELRLAEQELGRATFLLQKGHGTKEIADQRRNARDTAAAGLEAAEAYLAATERSVDAAEAAAEVIRTQIEDGTLTAPRLGRIQYRLAEPGEVLAGGGRVLTLLDLTDVFMTIFLPTAEAGRVAIGAEARIVLDALPEYAVPARVTFVASQAQFTPREVETRTEREKLMFRVKVTIDPDLLRAYIDRVSVGLPGEAFVRLAGGGPWPDSVAARQLAAPPR
ncbi:MAG TPA: HlyD family efflux transporter periplasmic adaptor subunit [Geminicoccaceae bacterium]|nr:HlyD family efflux transporter periplasmic adaptor subunit [Geminicoccus sp.]HMU49876.1 HlyD family efflux transporter periplasmic adaptor subunit [Geminicoccaceae bacterium]